MDQYSHDDPLGKGNPLAIFLDLQTTILVAKDPNGTKKEKKKKKKERAEKCWCDLANRSIKISPFNML